MDRRGFILAMSIPFAGISNKSIAHYNDVDFINISIFPGKNTIVKAIEFVNNVYGYKNVFLNLNLHEGDYFSDTPIYLNFIGGISARIIGNISNPLKVRVFSKLKTDLFYSDNLNSAKMINGLCVYHSSVDLRGQGSAFLADNGGRIIIGDKVYIEGFYYGVQSRNNSVVISNGSSVINSGDAGFFAFSGGFIQAKNALAITSRDTTNKLGSGFVAEYGGVIDCPSSRALANSLNGYSALSNGVIRAYNSYSAHNSVGYYTSTGGVIVAHDSLASDNTSCNWKINKSGVIERNSIQKSTTLDIIKRGFLCDSTFS